MGAGKWNMLIGGYVAIAATHAVAQPPLELPPAEPTEIEAPWLERLRESLQVGPLKTNLSIGASEAYTDNVFVTKNDKKSDFITTLEPTFEIAADLGAHELGLTAGATITRHLDNSDEDTEDYFIGGDGKLRFSEATFLFGGIEYQWTHENRESPDDVNGAAPTEYQLVSAYAALAHRSQSFVGRFGINVLDYDFDDVAAGGGGTINNDDRDRTQTEIGGRLGYPVSSGSEIFVQAGLDRRRYDLAIDDFGYRRDSDGFQAALGVRGAAGPAVQGELFVGYLSQDYDDPALDDVSVIDFGARADWRAAPRTQVTAFVDRRLQETTLPGASGYLSTTAGIEAEHQARPDLTARAHIDITENDYQGGPRVDHLVDLGLGVQHYFLPNFYLGTEYSLLQRISDVAGADFDENRIMLRLGAQLAPAYKGQARDLLKDLTSAGLDGVYVGVMAGHGNINTGLDGPRGAFGRNTAEFGDFGASGGVFAGYGVLVEDIYVGAELDAELGNAEWNHLADRTFQVRKRDSIGASLRLGYLMENEALIYGRFGVVGTRFETPYRLGGNSVTEDSRELGLRVGGGTEFPIDQSFFGRMEYLVTAYEDYDVAPNNTADNFSNAENLARVGIGYRFNPAPHTAPRPVDFSGPYIGLQAGHGALTSDNSGPRSGGVILMANRAGQGVTGGIFAGYGHTFGPIYLGAEIEAELSSTNWNIERELTGRIYSVEKKQSYGASVRLGYVLNDAFLVYGRAGAVRTQFNTDYEVGANYVTPENTQSGTRYGGGIETAAGENLRLRFDYTYTDYGDYLVDYNSNIDRFKNTENLFRIGASYAF